MGSKRQQGGDKPPPPGSRLYASLFEGHTADETLKLISSGLLSVKANAKRLVKDVELLLESRRFASARFLLTTADEEIAKAYILLDMCRLDFSRHKSTLRRLCRAFYDHVSKHAYYEVHRFETVHNMAHAKEIWDVETTKWWPSDPGSGEPDMPHDTYFLRETPLYVDYIEYDQEWFTPNDGSESHWFERRFGTNSFSVTLNHLTKLESAYQAGLFEPSSLKTLNEGFKRHFATASWAQTNQLNIYSRIAARLESECSIEVETTMNSVIHGWPLYFFLTTKRPC